jgi:hypothetical protein
MKLLLVNLMLVMFSSTNPEHHHIQNKSDDLKDPKDCQCQYNNLSYSIGSRICQDDGKLHSCVYDKSIYGWVHGIEDCLKIPPVTSPRPSTDGKN